MSALEHEHNVPLTEPAPPRKRIIRIVATLLAIAIVLALLQLVGVDLLGWVRALFLAMGEIPTPYIVAGIATQTINMTLVGLAYVAVWRAAYPGAKKLPIMQIVTCFVVGIALNGVLPMSMGSFVMAFMFLAIIPGATAAGVASGLGVTARKLINCLIAAVAIRNGIPVLQRDNDFSAMESATPLVIRAP